MSFGVIILIAFALALDAFAVAVGVGITLDCLRVRHAFRLAYYFGAFQFFMPVIGWAAGQTVTEYIRSYDHWIAFLLLSAVGIHMIYESLFPDEKSDQCDPTRGLRVLILAIATSIDALAVGLSLAFLRVSVFFPSVVIGIVAFLMTLAGIYLGRRVGELLSRRVEIIGGFVLIVIGLHILHQHLFGGA